MKAHILASDKPLIAGEDQIALCGKTVPQAAFGMVIDCGAGEDGRLFMNALLFCKDCAKHDTPCRYIYAAVDGEKAKHLTEETEV